MIVPVVCMAGAAHAHRGHESWIALRVQGDRVQGEWTLALHDLATIVPEAAASGARADDEPALAKALAARPALAAELTGLMRVAVGGTACPITGLRQAVAPRSGAPAWTVTFEARCPTAPSRIEIDLRRVFERDPKHLVLLKLEAGAWVRAAMFTAGSARQSFEPAR